MFSMYSRYSENYEWKMEKLQKNLKALVWELGCGGGEEAGVKRIITIRKLPQNAIHGREKLLPIASCVILLEDKNQSPNYENLKEPGIDFKESIPPAYDG
jgi:hypothetical protein